LVNEQKTLHINIAVSEFYDIKLCGSNTVIQIIHRNVGLKCFFIYLNVWYYRWFFWQLYFTR